MKVTGCICAFMQKKGGAEAKEYTVHACAIVGKDGVHSQPGGGMHSKSVAALHSYRHVKVIAR